MTQRRRVCLLSAEKPIEYETNIPYGCDNRRDVNPFSPAKKGGHPRPRVLFRSIGRTVLNRRQRRNRRIRKSTWQAKAHRASDLRTNRRGPVIALPRMNAALARPWQARRVSACASVPQLTKFLTVGLCCRLRPDGGARRSEWGCNGPAKMQSAQFGKREEDGQRWARVSRPRPGELTAGLPRFTDATSDQATEPASGRSRY